MLATLIAIVLFIGFLWLAVRFVKFTLRAVLWIVLIATVITFMSRVLGFNTELMAMEIHETILALARIITG